jgi:hypothetical protein
MTLFCCGLQNNQRRPTVKKHLLIFAIAVAIVSFGSSATLAQVPNIQIYFDKSLTKTEANCPPAPIGTVFDTLHVVALNCNSRLSAAEFMIDYPDSFITFLGDIMVPGALQIGNSDTGISLGFPVPVDAHGPGVVLRVSFVWMCNDCSRTNIPLDVLPHPTKGPVSVVTWPDLTQISAIGMRALICSTVPVEETSWGRIKSLYTE